MANTDNDVTWTRDMIKHFLDCLEQFPCLYDSKNKFYKNKHARRAAICSIREKLQNEIDVVVTAEQIKKKMQNIRTQLSRELAKKTKIKHSGMSADESENVEHIWWFERAQFIIPYINPRKSRGTIPAREMDENEEMDDNITQRTVDTETQEMYNSMSDDEGSVCATPKPSSSFASQRKRKRPKEQKVEEDYVTKKTVETLELLSTKLSAGQCKQEESNLSIFGKLVAAELSCISDPNLLEDAKHEINNILYKYKKQSLQVTTIVYASDTDDNE